MQSDRRFDGQFTGVGLGKRHNDGNDCENGSLGRRSEGRFDVWIKYVKEESFACVEYASLRLLHCKHGRHEVGNHWVRLCSVVSSCFERAATLGRGLKQALPLRR